MFNDPDQKMLMKA